MKSLQRLHKIQENEFAGPPALLKGSHIKVQDGTELRVMGPPSLEPLPAADVAEAIEKAACSADHFAGLFISSSDQQIRALLPFYILPVPILHDRVNRWMTVLCASNSRPLADPDADHIRDRADVFHDRLEGYSDPIGKLEPDLLADDHLCLKIFETSPLIDRTGRDGKIVVDDHCDRFLAVPGQIFVRIADLPMVIAEPGPFYDISEFKEGVPELDLALILHGEPPERICRGEPCAPCRSAVSEDTDELASRKKDRISVEKLPIYKGNPPPVGSSRAFFTVLSCQNDVQGDSPVLQIDIEISLIELFLFKKTPCATVLYRFCHRDLRVKDLAILRPRIDP